MDKLLLLCKIKVYNFVISLVVIETPKYPGMQISSGGKCYQICNNKWGETSTCCPSEAKGWIEIGGGGDP